MKLFLCSHFSSVGSLIKEEIENKKVAFIPTASLREGYTGYVGSARKLFKKLGAIVTEIDISTEAYSTIQSVFEDADVIYFTGGNSFFLIDQLRKTGTDELLKKELEKGIVREIKARGHKIFLDLKLHDIPNTVKKAMAVLSSLNVDMVNLHAAGTHAMMSAALEGLTRVDGTRPLLIAVTQLTSTSQQSMEEEIGIHAPLENVVIDYAKNARLAGLDGVVCSPLEAGRIHETCTKNFLTVTPGIRFADAKADDQVRITTPAKAREIGSDYIVVGRPITQAEDPVAAYRSCVSEFVG